MQRLKILILNRSLNSD